MKTTVITIFLLVFLIPGAEAGTILKLKNGNTMEWSNLTEEADQYCTQKSSGKFCIPKNAVASIAKEEENPDAVVIVNKTSDTGKEASRNELLDARKKKECEEMRTKINSLKVSFEELFALSNKYDNECLTPEQRKQLKEEKRNARIERKLNNIEMKMNQKANDDWLDKQLNKK